MFKGREFTTSLELQNPICSHFSAPKVDYIDYPVSLNIYSILTVKQQQQGVI